MTPPLRLAPLERAHLDTLRAWRNSPEVRAHTREVRVLTAEDQERWYAWLHGPGRATTVAFAVVSAYDLPANQGYGGVAARLQGAKLVGFAGLTDIDWVNRRAELSVFTVPRTHECEAARLIIRYGFDVLGLHRLEAETLTDDRDRLCRDLGFRDEGLRTEAYWRDGQWRHARRWGLLATTWSVGLGPYTPQTTTDSRI